ncbi:response regulator [Paraburkholderia bryophila]|uniref:response regulator n=1 Tax=Paraburkholderia bryophila TaxID=420952 RepID=UPI00234AAEDE|nr:response regulator [Paraburkholderia bryophila]WCM23604.1 response regulator [Paraburkholderia bryophila]
MASVLLVDDDVETLKAWSAACVANGYDVRIATNGHDAFLSVVYSRVDIVVADWRMPGMSGSELCHRLQTVPRLSGVAFILVSGEPSPPAFVRFDAFLRKPVDGAVLLATMRRLLADEVAHRAR